MVLNYRRHRTASVRVVLSRRRPEIPRPLLCYTSFSAPATPRARRTSQLPQSLLAHAHAHNRSTSWLEYSPPRPPSSAVRLSSIRKPAGSLGRVCPNTRQQRLGCEPDLCGRRLPSQAVSDDCVYVLDVHRDCVWADRRRQLVCLYSPHHPRSSAKSVKQPSDRSQTDTLGFAVAKLHLVLIHAAHIAWPPPSRPTPRSVTRVIQTGVVSLPFFSPPFCLHLVRRALIRPSSLTLVVFCLRFASPVSCSWHVDPRPRDWPPMLRFPFHLYYTP